MKQSDKLFESEVHRNDTLLAKWGILVGNLGKTARARRRAIATSLAREYSGVLTDLVLEAFMAEAKLQGVKEPRGWIVGILENDHERGTYFPVIVGQVKVPEKPKHDPGDDKVLEAGSKAEYERRAAMSGKTVSQEMHLARRSYMWNRMWGDGYSIADIAKEQGIDVQDCRYEISKECETQWDRLLNEDELRELRKTTGLSINEQREQITRRFELKDIHWRQCISFDTATKILKIAKDKGWPSPLKPMTLADWESVEAEKRQRAKGAKLTPQHEPRKDNRAETLQGLRDAPPPTG